MTSCTTKTFECITTTASITRFQCEFTWTIDNLKSRCNSSSFKITSLPFSAAENTCKLFLELHTPATGNDDESMELYLEVDDTTDRNELDKYGAMRGEFECSIMNSEGQEVKKEVGFFLISPSYSHYFEFEGLRCYHTDLPVGETRIHCLISYIHELDYAAIRDQCDALSLSKSHTFADFEKLLNDEKFSDITIYVGGKKFPCHKNILAARSSVFEAMLTHDMKEKNLNRIDIDDTDENTFQELLRYIYTGKVENIETMAFELLPMADKYDLAKLTTMCENTMCERISAETAVKFLSISNSRNLKILKTQAIEYIQTNLKKMIGSDAWNELISQPDLMQTILEAYGK